jgi:hypothetical protein
LEPSLPDGVFSHQKFIFGKSFWRAFEWKRLVHSISIWNIYLVHFTAI